MIEVTVTIRDSEKKKLSKDFLIYEPFRWEKDDPLITKCVKELLEEFQGEADDIRVRAQMILR